MNPEWRVNINHIPPDQGVLGRLVVLIGALMAGTSMILVAYFVDFLRGYSIAIMVALAVIPIVFLNETIYPINIGSLITLLGTVLFVRFLRKYPRHEEQASHVSDGRKDRYTFFDRNRPNHPRTGQVGDNGFPICG
jgi:Ca2+/Na+ antiporter